MSENEIANIAIPIATLTIATSNICLNVICCISFNIPDALTKPSAIKGSIIGIIGNIIKFLGPNFSIPFNIPNAAILKAPAIKIIDKPSLKLIIGKLLKSHPENAKPAAIIGKTIAILNIFPIDRSFI